MGQNIIKRMLIRHIFLFVSGFVFISTLAEGQKLPDGQQDELRENLEELDSRFRDFYLQRQEKERQLKEVLDSAEEYRQQRYREEQLLETQRHEYKLWREKNPEQEEDDSEYLKAQALEEKRLEEDRQQYVKRREKLQRIKDMSKSIPEDEEVGLVNPLENLD